MIIEEKSLVKKISVREKGKKIKSQNECVLFNCQILRRSDELGVLGTYLMMLWT